MIEFKLQQKTSSRNSASPLISCILLCLAITTASAADLPIADDFGPYSSDTDKQLRQNLMQLGDLADSSNNLNVAIDKFYERTEIIYSSDPIQQIIDSESALSAEREAKRVIGTDENAATEQTLNYARNLAPWLNKPAVVAVAPAINITQAEQSALTSAISTLDKTFTNLTDTINAIY